MFSGIAKPIDWVAIQLARPSVRAADSQRGLTGEVRLWLENPQAWFSTEVAVPELSFVDATHFQFVSPISSPWEKNNRVCGRFYASGGDWRTKPTVVLVHGWNSERVYHYLFPWLARELNGRGMNALFGWLPYHGARKPKGPGAVRNFISDDLTTMLEATRQAVAETRALIAWARAQGSPQTALWGISLGAWLAGLAADSPQPPEALVLMTPIGKMSRAADELAFCRLLKQALARAALRLERLDLTALCPPIAREKILLIEARHDLLAPPETVEELWRAWQQPEIWRLAQGHITILASLAVMRRTVNWLAGKTGAPEGRGK